MLSRKRVRGCPGLNGRDQGRRISILSEDPVSSTRCSPTISFACPHSPAKQNDRRRLEKELRQANGDKRISSRNFTSFARVRLIPYDPLSPRFFASFDAFALRPGLGISANQKGDVMVLLYAKYYFERHPGGPPRAVEEGGGREFPVSDPGGHDPHRTQLFV
jgi:hypothetical protein